MRSFLKALAWGPAGILIVVPWVCLSRFVSDRETWEIDSQFLLGPAFLVSPVLTPVSMEASGEQRSQL